MYASSRVKIVECSNPKFIGKTGHVVFVYFPSPAGEHDTQIIYSVQLDTHNIAINQRSFPFCVLAEKVELVL